MGKHLSSFEEKVDWLVRHPDAWRGWPAAKNDDAALIRMMKDDGLIAEGAHNYDIQDFGKLIAEARSRLRKARLNVHLRY